MEMRRSFRWRRTNKEHDDSSAGWTLRRETDFYRMERWRWKDGQQAKMMEMIDR